MLLEFNFLLKSQYFYTESQQKPHKRLSQRIEIDAERQCVGMVGRDASSFWKNMLNKKRCSLSVAKF